MLEGAANRLRRDQNGLAWLAWHTAFLTAYAPDKSNKFTKLERLIAGKKPAHRRTSWEQDFAAVSAWATPRK